MLFQVIAKSGIGFIAWQLPHCQEFVGSNRMDGSGLKEILDTVYSENAIVHMMRGKAVQREFRGHLSYMSSCG
jgi:hypothetical protein